ncbi:uncharacterized protein LOC107465444 [Arachis duranensis]|uniref:Uncharacterized protein LOC107465444 n=1 Tax=Arachis duranensis TaxID=130453 RepID=A0A6P4BHG2_ARADU|nr:uncharacterized protein LOC107465444 [Arachis duranensis]
MPEATGNIPNPVDFMATLENMATFILRHSEEPRTLLMRIIGYKLLSEHYRLRRFLMNSGLSLEPTSYTVKPSIGGNANAKELELLQLKQGQMTITEYTSKFEELCRFSQICQGAPKDFAEWMCIKYEGGLRSDLQIFIAPMVIRVFSELVNKSTVPEECVRRAAVEKGNIRIPFQRTTGRNFAPEGRQFGTGVNYSCGEPGQLANSYPEKKRNETGRVQQPGRVYTTSTVDADGSETLIRGNCEITGKILNALFDSGASHSFIAFEKADELGLKIVVIGYDLKVYNATHEAMMTRLGCPQVLFRIQQREFVMT